MRDQFNTFWLSFNDEPIAAIPEHNSLHCIFDGLVSSADAYEETLSDIMELCRKYPSERMSILIMAIYEDMIGQYQKTEWEAE